MYETKAAIIVLILISSVILCQSQSQLNRRQLLQQQIQEKIQQRQQQQLERQLERQNEEELQNNELLLIQPNNINNIISNQSINSQISSSQVNQSEIDGRPAAINQALLLDGIFNIPIQALRAVNDLVRFITTNFQTVTTAFRPPTTVTPAPDAESFDF